MSSTNSESVSSLELTAAVPANTDHIDLTAAAKESSSHPSDDESHSTGDDRGIPDLLPVTEDEPSDANGGVKDRRQTIFMQRVNVSREENFESADEGADVVNSLPVTPSYIY